MLGKTVLLCLFVDVMPCARQHSCMLKNITLRIDEKTLKKGKHIAVEQGKSLSKWVAELIERNAHNAAEVDKARSHALKMIKKGIHLGNSNFSRERAYE